MRWPRVRLPPATETDRARTPRSPKWELLPPEDPIVQLVCHRCGQTGHRASQCTRADGAPDREAAGRPDGTDAVCAKVRPAGPAAWPGARQPAAMLTPRSGCGRAVRRNGTRCERRTSGRTYCLRSQLPSPPRTLMLPTRSVPCADSVSSARGCRHRSSLDYDSSASRAVRASAHVQQ